MAGKKDYFGIAISGFRHASKGTSTSNDNETPSLYEQLKKYGSPAEKIAIRNIESKMKMPVTNKRTEVNPYS